MKTAEEIKKGLEHCRNNAPCLECKYADQRDHRYTCEDALLADALTYIQQLEAAHRTEYCEEADYDCVELGKARKRIAELEAQVPKWISVDNPPKSTSDYLVYVWVSYPDGIAGMEMRTAVYNIVRKEWTVNHDRTEAIGCPSHWMPLPETPKEG